MTIYGWITVFLFVFGLLLAFNPSLFNQRLNKKDGLRIRNKIRVFIGWFLLIPSALGIGCFGSMSILGVTEYLAKRTTYSPWINSLALDITALFLLFVTILSCFALAGYRMVSRKPSSAVTSQSAETQPTQVSDLQTVPYDKKIRLIILLLIIAGLCLVIFSRLQDGI